MYVLFLLGGEGRFGGGVWKGRGVEEGVDWVRAGAAVEEELDAGLATRPSHTQQAQPQ